MTISKDEIIAHIRRITQAEGTAPGRQRFETVTGINRHEWYGRHWARWGDALQEAGLSANTLQGQFGKEQILEAYISLIEKLGRIPTEGDIRIERRANTTLPSHSTLSKHLGRKRDRLVSALEYVTKNDLGEPIERLLAEAIETMPPEINGEDAEIKGLSPTRTGFVYMLRHGNDRHYKIGYTNSPDRRQYEIRLQLPKDVVLIHSIETDDPSGIEAYWHNRFKEKRMNGEWFNLTTSDINAFRLRKKFM